MAIETPVQICNMALTVLGVEEEVESIDQPVTRWEKRCAMFYNQARTLALSLLMPSFAITDEPVAINQDINGKFPVPSDCLRVLSVNGISGDKIHELNGFIVTDFPISESIEIMYLKNVEYTGLFSSEFVQALTNELAIMLAPLTKDNSKINYASTVLIQRRKEYAGLNSMRIRIKKHSDFPFAGSGFFYRK